MQPTLPAVDVILVVDHERLYNMLQGDLPPSINIIPLPKSGGVSRGKEERGVVRASSSPS